MNEEAYRRISEAANHSTLEAFGTMNVVLMPEKNSTLDEILLRDVTVQYLLMQIMGGMSVRRIFLIHKNAQKCIKTAEALLTGLKEAKKINGFNLE